MVSVELNTRECGWPVMALRGDLDVLDTASVSAVVTAVLSRNPDLILDLAGLEFIDCAALGALLRMQQAARRAGGDLLLAAPQPPVAYLLAITGLDGVSSVQPDAQEAAAAARDSRPAAVPAAGRQPFPSYDPRANLPVATAD